MAEKLIIYGGGPFAKLMHYYLSVDTQYNVSGFTIDEEYMTEDHIGKLSVVPFESVEEEFPPDTYKMLVAIGYRRMRNRPILFNKAKFKGYSFINYINSHAIVYDDLKLGGNNIILGNVNIEPGVVIGDNNIIWSDTLLGHNLILGNHNYISAKCLMAGDIAIGDLCFIGNGVTSINNLKIEDEVHVFPGAVLFKDAQKDGKYHGNPARHIGTHKGDGIVI